VCAQSDWDAVGAGGNPFPLKLDFLPRRPLLKRTPGHVSRAPAISRNLQFICSC
jgi:hypothetical protein